MKNQITYILILLLALSTTSCKKYFEVENSDRDTTPKNFETIEGFRASLAGTYGLVHDYYSKEFYIYPEVAGNMVDITKTGINVMKQQQDFSSDPQEDAQAVGHIWLHTLTVIANTNNILEFAPEYLKKNPGAQAEMDQIKAQTLFIRALAHFDLCRVYAQPYNFTSDASHPGVPVVLKTLSPEEPIGRSTVKEVYSQVIADLKEAEKLFGTSTELSSFYASKKTIHALLARIYLYMENWDEAINYSTDVINNSTLAYNSDYKAMFNNLVPGVETIFRLNGKLRNEFSLRKAYSLNDPVYVPADTLMSLFTDPTDIRKELFRVDPNNSAKYQTKKWSITVPYDASTEKYDPIVLRASEMYFIRAEANLAKERLQLCADDLKILIGRSLNKTPDEIVFSELSKEVLKTTIIRERTKEFCFEGHNFFDHTRMKQNIVRGVTTSSIKARMDYPSDYFVLPIPQSELDANPAMKGNKTINK